LVYSATAKIIVVRQQTDLEAALKELFPVADGFTDITGTIQSPNPGVNFGSEYSILQGNSQIGVALQASGGSYGGPITILVGVGIDGKITGIKILEHKDTPGLGANAANPKFYGQFAQKSVNDPFEVKEDVDAITAATITSRAVASVVKTAGIAAGAWLNNSLAGGSHSVTGGVQ
jgi:electron transport complex protein RnfG